MNGGSIYLSHFINELFWLKLIARWFSCIWPPKKDHHYAKGTQECSSIFSLPFATIELSIAWLSWYSRSISDTWRVTKRRCSILWRWFLTRLSMSVKDEWEIDRTNHKILGSRLQFFLWEECFLLCCWAGRVFAWGRVGNVNVDFDRSKLSIVLQYKIWVKADWLRWRFKT